MSPRPDLKSERRTGRARSGSRLPLRLAILARAAAQTLGTLGRRHPPADPRRILIAHRLLLGDTLMLTALIARLRYLYPRAEIVMTVAPACLPLYSGAPYGVKAVAWDARDAAALSRLQRAAPGAAFDLAIVPGDNRHALLARALGARWVIALAGDTPAWKNRLVDELVPLPAEPLALADLFAALAGGGKDRAGEPELKFEPAAWPAPAFAPFAQPAAPYAVLHVGAGSPLRLWGAEKWRALAAHLASRGLHIVWSAGPGEEALVDTVVGELPESLRANSNATLAGALDLAQMWKLLSNARILVALDSGVAHLAKHTLTPTVCLYGPGSALLFGAGRFWREAPFRSVTIENFACRDQTTLFRRDIAWVRRCQRTPGPVLNARHCPAPSCMQAIAAAAVVEAADALLADTIAPANPGKGDLV